ncbi:molybdate ABC transporter substrate-binding protein [Virgibacillus phasianinus]|uniref:Molybdate ABC transporter substrate-binding protein n=1 Tax=Virgibacillus phasianinus TaxID=2017483 RepID=A0A220U0Z2_9BACI|nr:molybdate ABC transporter substrate-binding protein [Virgibacillus phasianinus]ASK61788.1 molybdate ABC transporter substrate-binding protein [Virgibacillus phasianinus]
MVKRLFMLCMLLSTLVACDSTESTDPSNKELFISAAASLSGALNEISEKFEANNPNVTITLNMSGSGKLAQQIQQGAPVDVFLSADQHWMDVLASDNLLLSSTRINFTKNNLVLITQKKSPGIVRGLNELSKESFDQIAIGNPKSVPAGSYAKDALTNLGLWDELKDSFVFAKDVSQVLTYIETGNAEIGFVYGSDLHRAEGVKVLTEIDKELYTPIVYPAAVLSESEQPELAKEFLSFIQSDSAQTILKNYGFSY